MFYRCTHADGRVVVAATIEGVGATPLPGKTWREARRQVDMYGLRYVAGYGWFWAPRSLKNIFAA